MILDWVQRSHLNAAMAAYGRNADVVSEQTTMINQQDVEITNFWQEYITTDLTSEESALAGSFNLQWKPYAESRNHTMALASAEDYVGAIANLTGDATAKFDVVHTTLHKLLELQRDVAAKEYAQTRSDYESIF
jgi:hypothetical protein